MTDDVVDIEHEQGERGRPRAVEKRTDDGGERVEDRRVSEPHCVHLLEPHGLELPAECRGGLALCGEQLVTETLPSPDCEPGCERDVVYCVACLRLANEHNYDAGVDVDCPPGVIVRMDR